MILLQHVPEESIEHYSVRGSLLVKNVHYSKAYRAQDIRNDERFEFHAECYQ